MSSTIILEINKAKKFAFQLDAIDVIQSDIDLMDDMVGTAGKKMATNVDQSILVDIQDDAAAENKGATAGAISGDIDLGTSVAGRAVDETNSIEFVLDCALVLDEQNVPRDYGTRYLVVPPRMIKSLKLSELKDASVTGDDKSAIRLGRVGMVDDFTVYSSNLLPKVGAVQNILAGHTSALTFAAQVDQHTLEHFVNQRKFGKLCRGMTVYGHQTVKPESMVNAFVTL